MGLIIGLGEFQREELMSYTPLQAMSEKVSLCCVSMKYYVTTVIVDFWRMVSQRRICF